MGHQGLDFQKIWAQLRAALGIAGLALLVGCVSPRIEPPSNSATVPGAKPGQYSLARIDASTLAEGRMVFWAGGCASCHAAPNAGGDAKLLLGGGLEIKTSFGTFRVPNISPDKTSGIGNWSKEEFANAMLKGVSPQGSHYYPAFPYTSYTRMTGNDVMKLWAYLQSLPPVNKKVASHNMPVPFRSRQALGLWKKLYFKPGKVLKLKNPTAEIVRGQYLVEGPGHCGECHTPRSALGGFDYSRWLAGGKAPEKEGTIPNITPDETGIGDRTKEEIAEALKSGSAVTHFDTTGSSMENVRQNMAELSAKDRLAIAAYLKAVPAVSTPD